jgi:hypothetical protein
MNIRDSDLYKGAIEANASVAASESCFSKIAKVASAAASIEEFKLLCEEVEKLVKEELGIKTMPNPWRSAKSVCIGIKTLGLSFYDGKDLKGKTELQKVIKSNKSIPVTCEMESLLDQFYNNHRNLIEQYHDLSAKDQEKARDHMRSHWGLK